MVRRPFLRWTGERPCPRGPPPCRGRRHSDVSHALSFPYIVPSRTGRHKLPRVGGRQTRGRPRLSGGGALLGAFSFYTPPGPVEGPGGGFHLNVLYKILILGCSPGDLRWVPGPAVGTRRRSRSGGGKSSRGSVRRVSATTAARRRSGPAGKSHVMYDAAALCAEQHSLCSIATAA